MIYWLMKQAVGWRRRANRRTLVVEGRERSYDVHVPPTRDGAGPMPVLLALHGATMTGPFLAWFTKLDAMADRAGFLAVYPNGTGRRSSLFWNAGECCGPAMREGVDDVAFVRALLDDLARVHPVDPRRVFAVGLSNGGMMAYRLAAEMADRIAAVACVAGALTQPECRPSRPVSVLHIHGTADAFVPFEGGRGAESVTNTDYRPVAAAIRAWVEANGCGGEPAVQALPQRVDDGTRVVETRYGNGRDGAEVVLLTVEGGGHTWPGRDIGTSTLGPVTHNLDANAYLASFFERHARA